MYHRVIPSIHEEKIFIQPGMYVSVDTFRRQVAFFKKKFRVCPLLELVEKLETGQKVNGCCAITFDDGWKDNFDYAFPVLKEFKVPATVFLATGYIGTTNKFWPEELSFFLTQSKLLCSAGRSYAVKRFFNEIFHYEKKNNYLNNAIETLKNWPPDEREEVFKYFRSSMKNSFSERLLMNWNEANEMHSTGLINFGSHTSNHVILDQVSQHEAEHEINQSCKDLESHLGIQPELFAYPNGNFNSAIKNILKRNGFKGAVTTTKGWLENNSDLFAIPRIGIHEDISKANSMVLARILLRRF
jgi:peptidoglycan/xylan/chitin deacetylase (PgdA/CDA1 family)